LDTAWYARTRLGHNHSRWLRRFNAEAARDLAKQLLISCLLDEFVITLIRLSSNRQVDDQM